MCKRSVYSVTLILQVWRTRHRFVLIQRWTVLDSKHADPGPRRTCAVTPRDLIQTARRLAQPGAAQPTQADLHRAISTAYYALFHCLAAAAADLLTGSSRSPEWHQVYRALEHGKARSACQQQGAMRAFPMEIRSFAKAFVDLQGARHEADYALEDQYSKPDVLAIINRAEGVINEFEQGDVRHRRGFAVHVLFKRRQP